MTAPWIGDVIDGTWPAARFDHNGVWTLREGQGGGSRVSAATAHGPASEADITLAETAMREMGQQPIFMIRDGDDALDQQLDARGYEIKDPVQVYSCPTQNLTDKPMPRVTVIPVWEPLAIMGEIWATGGIGPARLEIMKRAAGPKTGFLVRHREMPAGTGYVAIHQGVAMVHAVEILEHQRRAGMGGWIMRAAAFWAAENGAHTLAVMCTCANTGANALYTSLGMQGVGHYHYRILPTEAVQS